jgi:formiminoglutamase
MLEYVVDIDDFDKLTFWRSPRSNRWWVQVPAGTKKGDERHRLVPCSYEDYLEASGKQHLPDRLMAAFRRFI